MHQVVDLKKFAPIGATLSDFFCFSIGRMLRHGGAPIWTALAVKTGEISFPTGKYGPDPSEP